MDRKKLILRSVGFVVSLILTLSAYIIIVNPEYFHLTIPTAIIVIFVLALIQATVQSIFFIDVWGEKGPPWNLGVFLSTISIIATIVVFSIWIMNHLNYNMMPPME